MTKLTRDNVLDGIRAISREESGMPVEMARDLFEMESAKQTSTEVLYISMQVHMLVFAIQTARGCY
jgi:hypothetical protein